ncbi:MAG: hypothetical protein VXX73_05965 [Pseudomonadota bacterium]|nr:hypothetical protein [Pseudomonadota bacterium]
MSKKSLYYVGYEQVKTYLEHHDHMCSEGYITSIINGEIDIDQLRKNILMYALEYGINTGMTVRREDA